MKHIHTQSEIEQRTAYVVTFMHINNDWFTNPENSLYGTTALVGTFLQHWARVGTFPDDWSDSRLIYVQGKFTEWLNTAPRRMWLLCMN